jgi:hypothetical protein
MAWMSKTPVSRSRWGQEDAWGASKPYPSTSLYPCIRHFYALEGQHTNSGPLLTQLRHDGDEPDPRQAFLELRSGAREQGPRLGGAEPHARYVVEARAEG